MEDKQSRGRFWQGLGILLSGLSTVVLIFVVGLTAHQFLQINRGLSQLYIGLSQRESVAVGEMQQAMQQMNGELQTQAQAVTDLKQSVHNGKDDLVIAEAEFLVKMANNNLQFENNIDLAIRLLDQADQDIAKLNDPRLYTIREAFSADLAGLHRAPQVDVPGVYLKLSALSDQLATLPVISQFKNPQTQAEPPAVDDQTLPWWRRAMHSTWRALGQVVVVRHKQVDVPFVAPDQQVFLYENLRSEVEKAEWGLLHRQNDIYQSSLQHVADWIKKYAVPDAPATQQLLTAVTQLQQIDVRPPSISVMNSLQALQNYFNTSEK